MKYVGISDCKVQVNGNLPLPLVRFSCASHMTYTAAFAVARPEIDSNLLKLANWL